MTYTWGDRIYIKDSQLKTVFYEQIPNSRGTQLVAFSLDRDGNPMILAQDLKGLCVSEIDVAEKKMVLKRQFGEARAEEITQVSFTEDGFLFCKGNNLFQYNYDKKTAEKILSLLPYGILTEDIRYLLSVERHMSCAAPFFSFAGKFLRKVCGKQPFRV